MRLLLVALCFSLAACSSPSIDGCRIFGPIYGSKLDTENTRSQVDGHNAKGVEACGWKAGR